MLKKHTTLILIAINITVLAAFTSVFSPNTDAITIVFLVLLMIYSLSSLITFQIMRLIDINIKNSKTFAMTIGVVPPTLILLLSIRQATPLDFMILIITVSAIVWYFFYKK